ncbi:MAG TPA: endonuclease/exonuclease/phosphatase family protein [Polyangia bacterium]|nr:endonuclease/exonuclease/phosphatase family protein [Polyangia bacterium]
MDKKIGFWRRLLQIAAIGYPLSLLAVLVTLRWIGERWWVSTTALYLPRWPFAAPLPLLALALALAGPRRLFLTQVAALLLLVPLLGFTLSLPRHASGTDRLRIFSLNVNGAACPPDELAEQVTALQADVAVFQEAHDELAAVLAAKLPAYHVQASGQFVLASRYPILEMVEPPKILYRDLLRSPRFVRFRLRGPQGTFLMYVVHPPSPREGLSELYGDGLRTEIETGRILKNGRALSVITAVAGLRTAQMCNVGDDAGSATDPVIIAGDTNLPGSSWAFAHCLGRFQDGFARVGNGFGYTFPSTKRRRPWMRIDRVLADDHFRFLHFEVAPAMSSDHRGVIADLEWAVAR